MLRAYVLCPLRISGLHNSTATLVALGSNMQSEFGDSVTNIRCGLDFLKSSGLELVAVSPIYTSPPLGFVRQARYANAVAVVVCTLPMGRLLRVVKQIERQMGRRSGVRWGPRPLDIDILAHRGQMASGQALGWVGRTGQPTSRKRGQAVLPHPEMHKRAFVLRPLCDVAPHWVHPVFNKRSVELLRVIPTSEALGPQLIENDRAAG
jgi:2-amino-4-hydroxy-6-hydroxymethyldihydropteridine diphosphokinase